MKKKLQGKKGRPKGITYGIYFILLALLLCFQKNVLRFMPDVFTMRFQTEHTEGIHIEQFLKSAGEEAKDYGFCCESKSDIGRRDCNVKKVLVNDAYMQNFSFRLLKGQCLDSFAMENQEHVAMIEEDLACKLFFSSDVLGQNISLDGTDYKIIGVYEDKSISFARDKYTRVYIPYGSAEG